METVKISVYHPEDTLVGSGFLNKLGKPMDICQVEGAEAAMVSQASAYAKDFVETLKAAVAFDGFSLVDIWTIWTVFFR